MNLVVVIMYLRVVALRSSVLSYHMLMHFKKRTCMLLECMALWRVNQLKNRYPDKLDII